LLTASPSGRSREVAHAVWDAVAAKLGCAYPGDEELDELLAVMQQRRGTRLFNAAVATHARIRRITRAAQKRWTARQHTYLPALIAESQTGQVANLTISNIISTANDWPAWNG
jgi:hypothetical protein